MTKVLIIDNYDSFTYNLYQLVGQVLESNNKPYELNVIRNDELSLQQIKSRNYDKIIISPGPGSPYNPEYFGVCGKVITELGQTTPILGICLGMQGICHFFGGKVVRAKNIMHGKTSLIKHNSKNLFQNLPQNIEVMRYHSLVCTDLPDCLEATSWTIDDGEIMALNHKEYPIFGVQFHPESFATEYGLEIIQNFLSLKT